MGKVIGLTGGIASGKSTVSKMLSELGAVVIDADLVARKIVEKGTPALDEIKNYFGEEYILADGQLDRKKLGALVFKDETALKKLNEITHPRIIQEIKKEINCHKKNAPDTVIIVDAALLIEMNMVSLVEEVWLVAIPVHLQLERLMKREGIAYREANIRVHAQMTLEEKKKYAHKIIDNSGGVETLRQRLVKMWREIE
ncbi:dephospho-CoA kinase [Alkaliphilus hydrothermalis]|uniref:Dephospho-CoA kinase n=1 Tax=Alkaliphilus hydrothermalis TaxID=1482730 RepID=A0ABS2NPF8_9FIRM|nr:dephospho-CoA kinase [Alkaliphilus hydrothermalis]MBM7614825.1 dephospho-CoA kinase [Alkaliphilus hydrothermalis]